MNSKNLIPQDGELYLFNNFFNQHDADRYFHQLLNEISWQQRSITMFGYTVDQPRLVSWHAKEGIRYRYSGITMLPTEWNQTLLDIKYAVEQKIKHKFNSAFLNLYRHGRDYMGWHRDNEKALGPHPLIASVSFGTTRKFRFKHMKHAELSYDLTLSSGSLLVMQGEIQHYWKHCIPKALRITDPRINITFRQITT